VKAAGLCQPGKYLNPKMITMRSKPELRHSDLRPIITDNAAQERENAIILAYIDQSPNLSWIVDEKENLHYANRAMLDYFEVDEKMLIRKFSKNFPHQLIELVYNSHCQVLKTGLPYKNVHKFTRSDGSERIFQLQVFPVKFSGLKLIGGKAIDITGSYRDEKDLQKWVTRLLGINHVTSDAVWDWDLKTGHVFRNKSFLKLIGFQNEIAFDLSWWTQLIHPDERKRVENMIESVIARKEPSWEDEYRVLCENGKYKNFLARGFIIYEKEKPIHIVGSLQDISRVKEMENQLVEEKLKQQKEIADAVIQAEGQERTRIGYELHDNVNQLLATAKLYLEFLRPDTEKEIEAKDKLREFILLAAEEIRKLSREMVMPDFSGKELVNNIADLVEDINNTQQFNLEFTYKNTDLEKISAGQGFAIYRIIQEQLKNTINYSKASKVEVYVGKEKQSIKVMVRDNGVGFDFKKVKKGIGLTNIYERAWLNKGRVELKTAPGKGCSLIIMIPVE
jgi:PAS domain S-box-containing protein